MIGVFKVGVFLIGYFLAAGFLFKSLFVNNNLLNVISSESIESVPSPSQDPKKPSSGPPAAYISPLRTPEDRSP